MHNGLFPNLIAVISMYNGGMPDVQARTQAQKDDPMFPKKSEHLKKLHLTKKEQIALQFFLKTL